MQRVLDILTIRERYSAQLNGGSRLTNLISTSLNISEPVYGSACSILEVKIEKIDYLPTAIEIITTVYTSKTSLQTSVSRHYC